ncbi:serine/threonine protein kinase [Deinococcus cellulosilyticus]|uniref:Protein kinase domain-containing protein n=1 Tax=Deinococcus cellulosilyticus (strain DSM 18568 / NBRC 106333 / KACC 11606 / 5516J-15) TaxID=1223518 RepID=A0A511NBF3_DEIC1|nr:serine/threonine-protein kinase [Deinococcus cellulosilyticus]GEM50124.1 hypothetical protein DC3_57590 [Deinococcus cellulosilyticus NBRC 106333 = KACC 11606]
MQHHLSRGTKLQAGKYTVGKVLGRGGFGITYQGANTILGSVVAIKEMFMEGSSRTPSGRVIHPSHLDYPQARDDFIKEAQILARFDHPSVVRVFDAFEENHTVYLVMELLLGDTLASLIQSRTFDSTELIVLTRQLLEGLKLLHDAGLIHRDVKPENILLTPSGRAVLIDFGTARAYQAGKTTHHTRIVTPGYAPLEQYAGAARYGPYTDLYALGASLYHLIVGEMPPPATDRVMGIPLLPLPEGLMEGFRGMVFACLSLKVEDRPQTVVEAFNLLNSEKGKAEGQTSITHAVPFADNTRQVIVHPCTEASLRTDDGMKKRSFLPHGDPDHLDLTHFSNGVLTFDCKVLGTLSSSTKKHLQLTYVLKDGSCVEIKGLTLPHHVYLSDLDDFVVAMHYQMWPGLNLFRNGCVDILPAKAVIGDLLGLRAMPKEAKIGPDLSFSRVPSCTFKKEPNQTLVGERYRDTTRQEGKTVVFDLDGQPGEVCIATFDSNLGSTGPSCIRHLTQKTPFTLNISGYLGRVFYTLTPETKIEIGKPFDGMVYFD